MSLRVQQLSHTGMQLEEELDRAFHRSVLVDDGEELVLYVEDCLLLDVPHIGQVDWQLVAAHIFFDEVHDPHLQVLYHLAVVAHECVLVYVLEVELFIVLEAVDQFVGDGDDRVAVDRRLSGVRLIQSNQLMGDLLVVSY